MGMYSSRAVTLLVLISDDVINRILKLDIQTNILVYVTRCCTDLTSKVLKERTFGQSSAVLVVLYCYWELVPISVSFTEETGTLHTLWRYSDRIAVLYNSTQINLVTH